MARTKKYKPRTEMRPTRNWLAVDARMRHTAGEMGDERKQQSRDECRKWKQRRNKDEE